MHYEVLLNGVRRANKNGLLAVVNILGECWRLKNDTLWLSFEVLQDDGYTSAVTAINLPLRHFTKNERTENYLLFVDSKHKQYRVIELVIRGGKLYIYDGSLVNFERNKPEFTENEKKIIKKYKNVPVFLNCLIFATNETGENVRYVQNHLRTGKWVNNFYDKPLNYFEEREAYAKYEDGKIISLVCKDDIEACSYEKIMINNKWIDYVDITFNKKLIKKNKKFYKGKNVKFDYYKRINELKSNKKYEHYFSAVLLTKDENEYVMEFLKENSKADIDYFYIYDNNDKPGEIEKIIKGTDFENKCKIIPIKKIRHIQYEAYEDWMFNYKNETKWVTFIDTDEFLNFDKNNLIKQSKELYDKKELFKSLDGVNSSAEYLKMLENYIPYIQVNWDIHSANGKIEKPKGTQKENYKNSVPYGFGPLGKIIIQPEFINRMYVHEATINPEYKVIENCFYPLPFKLEHYITRSLEEWVDKVVRGSCDPAYLRNVKDFLNWNPEITEEQFYEYLEKRGINKNLEMKG